MSARILVNDRPLYVTTSGVPVYLRSLLAHWPAGGPETWGVLTHGLRRAGHWPAVSARHSSALRLRPLVALGSPKALGRQVPNSVRRALRRGYAWTVRRLAHSSRSRAYFEPNHLAVATDLPTLTAFHDLSVVDHPEWHHAARVKQWDLELPQTLRVTRRWVTASQFTRDRLVQKLGVSPERIDVVPMAPRVFSSETTSGSRYELPERYLLVVGTLEPRKGLLTLLDAWAAVPDTRRRNCRLVLTGPVGWGDSVFWNSLVGHRAAQDVLTTGSVDEAALGQLLRGAVALLSASRYEGFGLPLVEAFALGTPVICSDIPTYREVAGTAALRVPAEDEAAWARAIGSVLDDAALRADLAAAGTRQVAALTWNQTAGRMAELLTQLASAG
ncbi:MAG: glycosyltransferase family 4 protein [Planctomycetota bacterium]